MNLHSLPWSSELLEEYGSHKVTLRITLSYFIEPNPAERLPTQKYSYTSHRLRFDLQRPLEAPEIFRQRINKNDRDSSVTFKPVDNSQKWELGPQSRNKGSVVSDVWRGTAAELGAQNHIAIIPEAGWWKYRKHLNRANQRARYSLIVSLDMEGQEIDIYNKIQNHIITTSQIEIQ